MKNSLRIIVTTTLLCGAMTMSALAQSANHGTTAPAPGPNGYIPMTSPMPIDPLDSLPPGTNDRAMAEASHRTVKNASGSLTSEPNGQTNGSANGNGPSANGAAH